MPKTLDELVEIVALRLEKQSGFLITASLAHQRARAILDDIDANDGLVVQDEAFDPDAANVA